MLQTASELNNDLADWARTRLHSWKYRTIGKFDPIMTELKEDFLWLFGRVDVYADRKYSYHFVVDTLPTTQCTSLQFGTRIARFAS